MHLINELRFWEYKGREERNGIPRKQVVEDKGEIELNTELHVVYVMNHVGVCGGSKVIFEHANGLSRLGAKVTIISHFPKPDWFPINVEYISVPFQIELAKAIPECSVIVATYWEQIGACVETGIAPVVYFEQGDFHLFEWGNLDKDKQQFINNQFQLAYKIITVSHEIAKLIKKIFHRESSVFHNSVDQNVFFAKNGEANKDKKYMLIVGSEQSEFKGISDLKQVFQKVKQRGFNIELLWVTPTQPNNSLGEVYVNPSQQLLGSLYRKADFYICGSYYESFALPPLEAMSSGTPVITTDNVGVNEYAINSINCLMNKPKDIDGMEESVIQILTDHDLYQQLRVNGLKTASSFSWNNTLNDLLKFYKMISTKKVKKTYNLCSWIKNYSKYELEKDSDEVIINSFLSQSNADEIMLLVKQEVIKDMPFYSWETLIKKDKLTSGRVEKLYIKVNKEDYRPDSKGILFFKNEEFNEALSVFWSELNELEIGTFEHAVCLRWVCLCLYELQMDTELFTLLQSAIKEYPAYSDLLFIYGMLLKDHNRIEESIAEFNKATIIQDALHYPEFIGDLKTKISSHLL
jgi:L-malate glycosyltransferase